MDPTEHVLPVDPTPRQVTIYFARLADMRVEPVRESRGLQLWQVVMKGQGAPVATAWVRRSDEVELLLARHSPVRLGECKQVYGATGYGIGPTVLGLMDNGWSLTFIDGKWRCQGYKWTTVHEDPEMAIAITFLRSHGY